MAIAIQQISPVAHLPLVLGVVRKLNVAALIDTFCPPHPAHVLSCGRGVEALLLAILDGHHALYKVGARLEERGMLPLLQPGLTRASLHDDRLGQILEALFAAHLNRVFGAIALNALEVYALSTPWLHQDTTTITLYGAYEEEARPSAGPVPPRPAYGHSKDGHDDLKQVLLSLGVSSEGLPLRMGLRDGNTSDSTETPVAIEECLALGLDGVRGIVADSKAYCKRTLGLCLERGVGLITLVPRTCAVRQEVETWGQQHGALPYCSKNLVGPGRSRHDDGMDKVSSAACPWSTRLGASTWPRYAFWSSTRANWPTRRRWHMPPPKPRKRSVSPSTSDTLKRGGLPVLPTQRRLLPEYEGRGQGRRGRQPRPWRYHVLHYRVEAISVPQKRTRRGRPPKAEAPQVEVRYRLIVAPEALVPSEDVYGWTVLATTMQPEGCTDAEMLQAYQEQHITVEPGFRWIKNPAAISPVWLEKPERIAALAMLTVVGLLVYAVIQRQVRLYLREHDRHIPGNKGLTATPTAAVVFALFTPVTLVHFAVDNTSSLQVHGVQDYHRIVCDAVGIDQAWYQGAATEQNSPPWTTPP